MNRSWLGVGLLTLFLAMGLYISFAMNDIHEPISEALEEAAEHGLSGDLETGAALARQAHRDWQSHWNGIASVADHAPMDEIDGLFAQMEVYAQAGQAADFAACCARLSKLVHAVGEAHGPSWWNLL